MPLKEVDLNLAEAQKLYFPHTQAVEKKRDLKTYQPTKVPAKEHRRKKRLLITYDENVISPENKCEDWLGLFDDQLDDEEELKRQKKQPKQVISKRDEKAQRLSKKQHLKMAILDKENVSPMSATKSERTTKSFDMTPKILPSKRTSSSAVKRKISLQELANEHDVFEDSEQENSNEKGDDYDQEYSSSSKPAKKTRLAKKRVYKKKADRKKEAQEELDKLAYEEWRKEYEDIMNYPLVVECVDHDF